MRLHDIKPQEWCVEIVIYHGVLPKEAAGEVIRFHRNWEIVKAKASPNFSSSSVKPTALVSRSMPKRFHPTAKCTKDMPCVKCSYFLETFYFEGRLIERKNSTLTHTHRLFRRMLARALCLVWVLYSLWKYTRI